MTNIINLEELHSKLKLSDEQKTLLSEAFENLIKKYNSHAESSETNRLYFDGVADGINNCFKVINGINDDYNSKPKTVTE